MAAHAYSILDGYIYGFTLTELTLPFSTSEGGAGVAEIAGNIMDGFRPGEYGYLAEMALDRARKPGYKYGDEFEFGLDLILDGNQVLESVHAHGRQAVRRATGQAGCLRSRC